MARRQPRVPDSVCRFSFADMKSRSPDALMKVWLRWRHRRTNIEGDIANWASNYATYKNIKQLGAAYHGTPKQRLHAMKTYKNIAAGIEKRIRETAQAKCGTLKGLSGRKRKKR